MEAATEKHPTITTPASGSGRLWVALIVGLILAAPTGWLMAPIAVLPYFLGLYFYMIFGLLIGALQYRLASPAAPLSRRNLYIVACTTGSVLWLAGLFGEYQYLPKGAFRSTRSSIRLMLTPENDRAIQNGIADHIRRRLATDYPPGGVIGYARWASTSGVMPVPRVVDQTMFNYALRGRGWRWVLRVVLSLVLTLGMITAQMLSLASKRSDREAADPAGSDLGA